MEGGALWEGASMLAPGRLSRHPDPSRAGKERNVASTNAGSSGKEAFWEKYFLVYDILNLSPLYQRLVTRHVELLQPVSGEDILDAGAGTGNVTRLLAV